jgi:hypothetical protein
MKTGWTVVVLIDWFQLDDLPHRSSGSSLNANQLPVNPVVGSLENLAGGEFMRHALTLPIPNTSFGSTQDKPIEEWEQKLYGKQGKGGAIVLLLLIMVDLRLSSVCWTELLASCSYVVHCCHTS